MEKRCYICGVAFCEHWLVTCTNCKSAFIHEYCMKFCQNNVPNVCESNDWVCEDCVIGMNPPRHVARRLSDDVVVIKRQIKFISPDEAMAMASGSLVSKGNRHLGSPEKPCKKVEVSKKRAANVGNMVPLAIPPPKRDLQICRPQQKRCKKNPVDAHMLSAVTKSVDASTPSSTSKPFPESHIWKEHSVHAHVASSISKSVNAEGGHPCKDTLTASKTVKEPRLRDAQVRIDKYVPNHPASFAAWKGCFRTSGFGETIDPCDDFWGYLPQKVAIQAIKFSKQLPDNLDFKAVPRFTVWKNMFKEGGPYSDDIGLYFFPAGDRSEQCYTCLVSCLEKHDIVLKSCIHGVELLIFISKHLEDESQKINEAYYLFGLFVPPEITFKAPQVVQKRQSPEPAKRHVLENGEPVGRTDVPVPRDSHQSSSKGKALESGVDNVTRQATSEARQQVSKVQDGNDLASPPGFIARIQQVGSRAPPGFEETARRTDVLVPRDSHPNPSKVEHNKALGAKEGGTDNATTQATAAAIQRVSMVHVKAEKWDGSPPGFTVRIPQVQSRVPPGFEETGRVRYRTISELLQSPDGDRKK